MSSSPRKPVRLLYQMTTAKQMTDLGMAEVERRLAYVRSQVEPATSIDIAVPSRGPGSIESRYDSAMAVPLLLEAVMKAETDGYDAVVISCFGDPGLDACREIVSIPVVSSGQASMHVAAQLGARFSVISPKDGAGSRVLENPRKYGFHLNYASTRGSGLSVMDLARDRQRTVDRLAEVGGKAVQEDGADTLILGCMSMAFHDISRELQDRIGVPVVNPVQASLSLAELLVRAGLSQSRRAYPKPDKLEIL
jgi:allantoin racemase